MKSLILLLAACVMVFSGCCGRDTNNDGIVGNDNANDVQNDAGADTNSRSGGILNNSSDRGGMYENEMSDIGARSSDAMRDVADGMGNAVEDIGRSTNNAIHDMTR